MHQVDYPDIYPLLQRTLTYPYLFNSVIFSCRIIAIMIRKYLFTSLLWVPLVAASTLVPRDLCSTVSFTLPVVAQNGLFSAARDPNNETQIEDFVSDIFSGSVVLPTGT